MASFSRKRKRGYRMQIQLAAESHVPCFQERVGTSIPGYMIPDRLPWRLRARPSATLHEIQVRPANERQSELVLGIVQKLASHVKVMSQSGSMRLERNRAHYFTTVWRL